LDSQIITLVLFIFSTILSSGFLSLAEASIMSLNKNKFMVYKSQNSSKLSVKYLDKIKCKKQNYLTAIIILNTIVNIGGSMIIGGLASTVMGGIPSVSFDLLFNISLTFDYLTLFTASFTLGILYFAEMIPKLVASQKSLPISLFVAIPLFYLEIIIRPLVWFSLKICSLFVSKSDEPTVCLMEVKSIIKEANSQGIIKDRELDIINNTFSLSEKTVNDLMMSKTDIEYINGEKNILEYKEHILSFNHNRIIVTNGSKDEHPIGVVVVKDLLQGILRNEDKQIKDYMHELLIVNDTDSLSHILSDFNDTADHLALVQCKDGTYKGVLAVEDVLDGISIGFPN